MMNTIDEFKNKGFVVVRKLVNDTKELYNYTLENKINGDLDDKQIPNTPSFYNDKEMVKLQLQELPHLEELTGLKLFKTYTYYRTYKPGDILTIHKDRPACEISVTLNIGYKNKPWAIGIKDYDGNPYQFILEPGDGLIYRGCDLEHWRDENKESIDNSQVFMHYVDQNGPCSWARDDNK